jgi:glycosyltransferase involved in cell wall biosynthesis
MPGKAPKVSVCLITYNHERYIARALQGVAEQQTDFPFDIVIGDDASSDGTRDAVVEFVEGAGVPCRLLPEEGRLGITRNLGRTLDACQGDYVALLEGDDYWTDRQKLARQVRLLDRDPGVAACFHSVCTVDDEGRQTPARPWPRLRRSRLSVDDLLVRGNFLPTSSVVFRNRLFGSLPGWYFDHWIGDLPLHALNALHGCLAFIDAAMGAYRIHAGGAFSVTSQAVRVNELIGVYEDLTAWLPPPHASTARSACVFLRAAEALRTGRSGEARRLAWKRATAAPYDVQALKALVIAASPPLYRRIAGTTVLRDRLPLDVA